MELHAVGEFGEAFVEIVDGELRRRLDKGVVQTDVIVILACAEMQGNAHVCAGPGFGNFSEETLAVVGFDRPGDENTFSSILSLYFLWVISKKQEK